MKKLENDTNMFCMLKRDRRNFIMNRMDILASTIQKHDGNSHIQKCYENYVINVVANTLVAYIQNQIHLRAEYFELHTKHMYIADQKL